jgi:hypothetical protein
MGVEPNGEFGRVVDPAIEPARDIAKAEIGLQRLLGIDRRKRCRKSAMAARPFSP